MEKLTKMNEFNIAVKDSVSYKENIHNIGNHKYYYSSEYGNKIAQYLIDHNVESKESEKGSLASTSSSARLCTNYFFDNHDVIFEKPIKNDVSSIPTKMDAVVGNVFFECKCQEIVNGEHELLRKGYLTNESSKLFKEFCIPNDKIAILPKYKRNGEIDYEYLDFSLRDLGIDLDIKYYEARFNVKQLICHLIAIAHSYKDEEEKTLKYIVFRPNKNLIIKSEQLKEIYSSLDKEFSAITDSKNIKNFVEKHKIKLQLQYVDIGDVEEHFKV